MHHLEIDRVTASYDGKEQVLVDVSIRVAKGEINGCAAQCDATGDTTALEAVARCF